MRLAVIVPCLNEEKTLGAVLAGVPENVHSVGDIVKIVVNDGSTDRTARIAQDAGARVLSHAVNRGVGAAFSTGLEAALREGADVVVSIDGDGQFDPADIPRLVRPILENEADFVTASRFLDKNLIPEMPAIKKWGNRRIAYLVSRITGEVFRDVSCGFRAYSRQAALNLNLMGKFTYTHEVFLDLAFKGFRILEIPVEVRGVREFGSSRVADSIPRYALNAAKIILKSYRDYRPFSFFGRIAFVLFAISSGLLAWFFGYYLWMGMFKEQLWSGFLGGALGFAGLVMLVIAIVADMLDRIRLNQEKILYYQKAQHLGEPRRPPNELEIR